MMSRLLFVVTLLAVAQANLSRFGKLQRRWLEEFDLDNDAEFEYAVGEQQEHDDDDEAENHYGSELGEDDDEQEVGEEDDDEQQLGEEDHDDDDEMELGDEDDDEQQLGEEDHDDDDEMELGDEFDEDDDEFALGDKYRDDFDDMDYGEFDVGSVYGDMDDFDDDLDSEYSVAGKSKCGRRSCKRNWRCKRKCKRKRRKRARRSGSNKCFGKDMLVVMADGTSKKVQDIELGDVTKLGGQVTGVQQFLADPTDMFDYNGVLVTGVHPVLEGVVFRRVHSTKKATKVTYEHNVVYDFSTKNNRLLLVGNNGTITFTDYDEHPPLEKIETFELRYLNNRIRMQK